MKWILFFSVFTLIACSNSKNVQKSDVSSAATDLFSEDTISLSFERTLCFGACPAYKITIKNDGTCLYEGYKFVDMEGQYTASISKERMQEIQTEAERIAFFSMKDKYDNVSVTDVPSVIIMMPGPYGRKEIVDRFEAPQDLKSFEKYLDSILLDLDWKSLD